MENGVLVELRRPGSVEAARAAKDSLTRDTWKTARRALLTQHTQSRDTVTTIVPYHTLEHLPSDPPRANTHTHTRAFVMRWSLEV